MADYPFTVPASWWTRYGEPVESWPLVDPESWGVWLRVEPLRQALVDAGLSVGVVDLTLRVTVTIPQDVADAMAEDEFRVSVGLHENNFQADSFEFNGVLTGASTELVVEFHDVDLSLFLSDRFEFTIDSWSDNAVRMEVSEPSLVLSTGEPAPDPDPEPDPEPDPRNWTNVFDVGPCRVELQNWGETVPPERYADWGIESIEVIDGEIVVTSVDGGSIQGLQFAVIPEFPTESAPVRVIGQRWQFNNGYGYNMVNEVSLQLDNSTLWDNTIYVEQGEGFPDAEVNPDPAELSRGGVAWDTVLLGGSSG